MSLVLVTPAQSCGGGCITLERQLCLSSDQEKWNCPSAFFSHFQIIISFFLRERSLFSQRTFSTDLSGFSSHFGLPERSFLCKESTVCWIFSIYFLQNKQVNSPDHQTPNSLGVYEALSYLPDVQELIPFQVILSSSEEDKIKRTGIEDRLLKHREILESVYSRVCLT